MEIRESPTCPSRLIPQQERAAADILIHPQTGPLIYVVQQVSG